MAKFITRVEESTPQIDQKQSVAIQNSQLLFRFKKKTYVTDCVIRWLITTADEVSEFVASRGVARHASPMTSAYHCVLDLGSKNAMRLPVAKMAFFIFQSNWFVLIFCKHFICFRTMKTKFKALYSCVIKGIRTLCIFRR